MDVFSEFLSQASLGNVVPVVDTMPADLLTPLGVYLRLSWNADNSFLLESVEGGESLARFSFIGCGPDKVVRGNSDGVTVTACGDMVTERTGLFEYLTKHFSEHRAAADDSLPLFTGGAIGFLGFSCVEWFEPSLKRERSGEKLDGAFMFFSSIVAFDHVRQTISMVSLVFTGDAGGNETELRELFDAAKTRNKQLRAILETGKVHLPAAVESPASEITSNWKREDFEAAVSEIKELIAAGECYQVVLSQRFSARTNASAVQIYRALRSLNPSPYMFLLNLDKESVIGASPEMLVRCRGNVLEYRPIAGTRPRGKDLAEDAALADELRADRKEVAEHLMLVDLGRNDLGKVAEFGTVEVEKLMIVEKYSHVQHLVSSVTAKLRRGLTCFDALAATFPAGTVSGAPKVSAIKIIDRIEPSERGIYAGAVGYFDYSGNMDTCIAIRTLVLENGVATIQAGAGIVADSVPALEYDETVNKAAALLKALRTAQGGS